MGDGKIEFVQSRSKKDLNRPTSKFINPAFSPELDAVQDGPPGPQDGAFAQPSGHYFPGAGPSRATELEDDLEL